METYWGKEKSTEKRDEIRLEEQCFRRVFIIYTHTQVIRIQGTHMCISIYRRGNNTMFSLI